MTQSLRSGCGSFVEPGSYYWAWLDRKQTSGRKRKRNTAPMACKTRRRYTRRSSHKPSKSDEEDRDNIIVCVTSLKPLRAKHLAWTHDLVQKEDWVGKRELTLEDVEYPFEQAELGAKVTVASWEERSLDQSSYYYVRTRKPNLSEGSDALDRAWPHTGVDNTQCGRCHGPICDDFSVCSSCHVSFHDSCLSPKTPLQWVQGDLRDCDEKVLECLACNQSLRHPSLLKADSDIKNIAICIDLGSSHVKVSTWLSGENAPQPLGVGISSSCWYDGTWHHGDYASVVAGHPSAFLLNPIKRAWLDDPEALKQLESCGGSTVTDIVLGLLKFIFKRIDSQRRVDFASLSDANLYLCMASPSGMTDTQKTVVLSAVQDFESYKPAGGWASKIRSVTVIDLPEPECALWGQLGADLPEKAGHRYQVIDIGGFTTCASTFSILPSEPCILYEASRSSLGGSHQVVHRLMEQESLDPASYSAVLDYVLKADEDASAASAKVCGKSLEASYRLCRKNLLANLESFSTSTSQELEELNAQEPRSTEVVLIGGGAMDNDRADVICGRYTGRTVENKGSSSTTSSSVLAGLQNYYELYVLRRKMKQAPITVLLEQDSEDDSKGYLVVMKEGDPLHDPKLPLAQVRPGELVLFYLTRKDTDNPIPIYGTTEDVRVGVKGGYHVVDQKPAKMFKIAELSVPRTENQACAHKLVRLIVNPAARTIQADVMLLDVKGDPDTIRFRELTVESVLADKETFQVHMHIKSTVPLSLHGICQRKGAQWESESIQWAQSGDTEEVNKDDNAVGRGANSTEAEEEEVAESLDIGDIDAEGEPEDWTSGPDGSSHEVTET